MSKVKVHKLINEAIGVMTSKPFDGESNLTRVINAQAWVEGSGVVSAEVVIEGSNNGTVYEAIGTLTLSGTAFDSKSLAITKPWAFIRAGIDEPPVGTNATVNCFLAI